MRRHPFIYEINTWVWLDALSRREGAAIDLAGVPGREWDALAELGFDAVWLMGVWERSPAGIAIALENDGAGRELPARAARLRDRGRGRLAVLHPRLPGRRAPGRAGRAGRRAGGAGRARARPDPRLRAEPRRPRPPVDGRASRVLRARQRRRPRARSGVVRARRRPRPRQRPRPVLPGLAGRRAAERLLARPAGGRDRDARARSPRSATACAATWRC